MNNRTHIYGPVLSGQPLRILTARITAQTPVVPVPSHDHPFYQLEILTAGRTEMAFNGRTQVVHRGMTSFFRPFHRHAETGLHSTARVSIIHVKFEADAIWASVLNLAPVQRFHHSGRLRSIVTIWQRDALRDRVKANLSLALLFLDLADDKRYHRIPETEPAGAPWLSAALRYIDEHASAGITAADVARHVHMRPDSFSRVFRRKMGHPPVVSIRQTKIERAKRLLGEGAVCKEVAFALAFPSVAYFSRVFKQICGIAPSRWMETILSA